MSACPLNKTVMSYCMAKTIVRQSSRTAFASYLHPFPLVGKMEFVQDICTHFGWTRKLKYISKCPLVLRKSNTQLESRISIANAKWTDGVILKCSICQDHSLLLKSELQVTWKHCQHHLRVSLPFPEFFLMIQHAVYIIKRWSITFTGTAPALTGIIIWGNVVRIEVTALIGVIGVSLNNGVCCLIHLEY